MKIDVSKIDGFESMSAEEKIKALTEYDIPAQKPEEKSDEIARLKNAINKASSDAAEYKRKLQEKMSESEKAEAERLEKQKAMEEKLKSLERDKTISDYVANFVGAGYGKELAQASAEAIADGNMKIVFDNLKTFMESHDKEFEAQLLKDSSRKPNGGDQSTKITREQFDNMSYAERAKLYSENKDLYDELSK